MKQDTPQYNLLRKKKVTTQVILRVVISVYLLYSSWQIFNGAMSENSTVGVLISCIFAVLAILFGAYTWKQHRTGLKSAELTPEELEEERVLAEKRAEEGDF